MDHQRRFGRRRRLGGQCGGKLREFRETFPVGTAFRPGSGLPVGPALCDPLQYLIRADGTILSPICPDDFIHGLPECVPVDSGYRQNTGVAGEVAEIVLPFRPPGMIRPLPIAMPSPV